MIQTNMQTTQSGFQTLKPNTTTQDNTDIFTALNKMNVRRITKRQPQNLKFLDRPTESDDEGPELFKSKPSDDIPRNKLTEKLGRGL